MHNGNFFMVMSTIRHIIILFFVFSVAVSANLTVRTDVCVFQYNDTLNLLELYYSFPSNSLQFETNDELKTARVGFGVAIIEDGMVVDSAEWVQEISYKLTDNIEASDLIGIRILPVRRGNFELKFIVVDMLNRDNRFIRSIEIKSPEYHTSKLTVSDLQIAAIIEQEATATSKWSESFKKNSLYVVPNPGTDVIGSSPVLYSYLEIYNAQRTSPDGLKVVYTVLDAARREVFSVPRAKRSFSDAMVEHIALPVDALSSGVYYLRVTVQSSSNPYEDSVSVTKKIYVTNYEIPPQQIEEYYESLSFEQSEFATMNEEKVAVFYEQIKPISTEYERGVWDKCETLGARQRFLYTFWEDRNTDTTKSFNPALEEFRDKINYANRNFKYGLNEDGWRTDRGKIYVKYGKPTQVLRYTAKGEQPAYEVWNYDEMQGGIEFVFIDFRNNGMFRFVHSTALGEMSNPNWFEQYIEKQDPDPNFRYFKR